VEKENPEKQEEIEGKNRTPRRGMMETEELEHKPTHLGKKWGREGVGERGNREEERRREEKTAPPTNTSKGHQVLCFVLCFVFLSPLSIRKKKKKKKKASFVALNTPRFTCEYASTDPTLLVEEERENQ